MLCLDVSVFTYLFLKKYIVVGIAQVVETFTWIEPDRNRYLLLLQLSATCRFRSWIKFVATLNISELHHPKCALTNTINNLRLCHVSCLPITLDDETRTKAGKSYYYI